MERMYTLGIVPEHEKRIADYDSISEYIEEIWGCSVGSGIQEWHLFDLEEYIKYLSKEIGELDKAVHQALCMDIQGGDSTPDRNERKIDDLRHFNSGSTLRPNCYYRELREESK